MRPCALRKTFSCRKGGRRRFEPGKMRASATHKVISMNIFRRPDYKSDTTQFIEQLKQVQPKLEAEQRHGLGLLWNKLVDRDIWKGFRSARVAQKPYVYQTNDK